MPLVEPVPAGSIYVWCYKQGLRGVSWEDILSAISVYGIQPRQKDYRNWLEGSRKHLGTEYKLEARGLDALAIGPSSTVEDPRIIPDLDSYQLLNCDSQGYEKTRWIPCGKDSRPLTTWSAVRCTLDEARFWPGACYLAENLKGCRWIVLDFDIDHDKQNLDWELRTFGMDLLRRYPTQALYKPDWMGFHLAYWTDKDIRTKHLPHVNIDICGNSPTAIVPSTGKVTSGQVRYFKKKESNKADVGLLTDELWRELQEYSLSRDVFRKVKR